MCGVRSKSTIKENQPSKQIEQKASNNLNLLKQLIRSDQILDRQSEFFELKHLVQNALKEITQWSDSSQDNNIDKIFNNYFQQNIIMQDQEFGLYRVLETEKTQKIQSYLITLVDGTGSMVHEYDSIIKAHDQVFGFLGENQKKYQWEEQLFPLQPFRNATRGNISQAFKYIFEILTKSNQFPKNLTFLFISDGEESFDQLEISEQIKIMKENYFMQFISVAIGDQFPNAISNHLRNEIHNQNSDCEPIHLVKRDQTRFFIFCENNRPTEEIYQDFLQIFEKIKEQLQVYENQVINQLVYKTLGQTEPTNLVQPKELVAAPQSLNIKGLQICNDIQTANEMLNKTIQQDLLIPAALMSSEELKETCNRIQQREYDILNAVQVSQSQCEGLLPKIEIIEQIKEGILKPLELNDQQKTEIQVNLNKPNFDVIIEKIVEQQNPNLDDKLKLSQNKMSINNLRPGCVIRCTSAPKQQIIENEGFKQLNIILEMSKKNKNQDLFVKFQQLKNETEEYILQKFIFNDNSDQRFVFRQSIGLVKLLDQVLQKTKGQNNEIIQMISNFLGSKDQIKVTENDPYVQKYKNFNLVNQISSEMVTLKYIFGEFLSQQFNSEQVAVEQFEKIICNCLKSCSNKLKRQKKQNQMQFDKDQLNKQIKEIIQEMKKTMPLLFKNLKIVFPSQNFTSFRRVIGILYQLDVKIYQRETIDIEQMIETFNQCIFSKGFIKEFIASIEAVACCDYDYLYREVY